MHQVDTYIESLPEHQQELMQTLRAVIIRTVPGVEEKFSYKIPFYYYHGMLCYLGPGADGVVLSFCRGKDLVDAFPQLEQKGRAVVASVTVRGAKDIIRLELIELIATAAKWNEEVKRKK
jgi:hypothetical protein